MVETVIPGYVGKPKGLKQVLYERGLLVPGMKLQDMRVALSKCPDFQGEMSVIKKAVHSRGHILLLSPKCHPELAGLGIEYSWGKSKLAFRREVNDFVPKHFHLNVCKALSIRYLPLSRIRNFARKTRDYLHVYEEIRKFKAACTEELSEQEVLLRVRTSNSEIDEFTFKSIEKMLKQQKVHRNVADIDTRCIRLL